MERDTLVLGDHVQVLGLTTEVFYITQIDKGKALLKDAEHQNRGWHVFENLIFVPKEQVVRKIVYMRNPNAKTSR